jgi:hypothetical protein
MGAIVVCRVAAAIVEAAYAAHGDNAAQPNSFPPRTFRSMSLPLTHGVTALAVLMACAPASAQQLFKCTDGAGHVTYSDRMCNSPAPRPAPQPAPAPKAAPAPAAQAKTPAAPAAPADAVNRVASGKVTPGTVEDVLRHAMDLGDQNDYRRQCALAAPSLRFRVVDHSAGSPQTHAGGRSDICALQELSATMMAAAQLRASTRMGKPEISVHADGTRATARYETVTTIAQQGTAVMATRCKREETLALHGVRLLYTQVDAVCQPAG